MTYKFTIWGDQCPENPRDWGTQPPLYYDGGRWSGSQSLGGFDFSDLMYKKVNTAIRQTRKTLDYLDVTREKYQEEKEYCGYKNVLDYIFGDASFEFDVEDMGVLLDIVGYTTYQWTSTGYSQGDRLDCLLVASDEWIKETGVKKINLESCADLFDARMWGDVYGYTLVELKDLYREDGTLANEKEEVGIDSCGGCYGDTGIDDIYEQVKEYITKEEFEEAKENVEW